MRITLDVDQILSSTAKAVMGHGGFPPSETSRGLSLMEGLIEITRPFLLIMAVPLAGVGAFLAKGPIPSPPTLGLGVLAVVLAVAGIHTFNDWVDRTRDLEAWPHRPIPAGRVPAKWAPVYAIFLMGVSLVITGLGFNRTAFTVLLVGLILGIVYCLVLRDKVGYLSLPPIIGLFPLGGWAAVAPETLFSSNLPWFLGAVVLTWQAAHIMVYSPAHPLWNDNGVLRCEKKALFFFPTPGQAATLGLLFTVLLLVESLVLVRIAGLGVFYLSLVIPSSILAVGTAVWGVRDPYDRRRALFAFNAASMFATFLSGGAVLDVMFRRYLHTFLSWAVSGLRHVMALIERDAMSAQREIYIAALLMTIVVAVLSTVGLLVGIAKSGERPAD